MPFNTIKPLPCTAARRQIAGEMSQEITMYDPVDGLPSLLLLVKLGCVYSGATAGSGSSHQQVPFMRHGGDHRRTLNPSGR